MDLLVQATTCLTAQRKIYLDQNIRPLFTPPYVAEYHAGLIRCGHHVGGGVTAEGVVPEVVQADLQSCAR